MQIQTVGIVGAGTMGNGIAQACAVAGLKAVMVDISDTAVAKGLATLSKSLDRLVSKDKISEADKAAALAALPVRPGEDPFVVIVPAGTPAAEAATFRTADLANIPLIGEHESSTQSRIVSGLRP